MLRDQLRSGTLGRNSGSTPQRIHVSGVTGWSDGMFTLPTNGSVSRRHIACCPVFSCLLRCPFIPTFFSPLTWSQPARCLFIPGLCR